MPIHILQCVFHVEKLFCTHRFFHKYEQTCTEKIVHALPLILMGLLKCIIIFNYLTICLFSKIGKNTFISPVRYSHIHLNLNTFSDWSKFLI